MTPTEVINMFDKASAGLQMSRQAHDELRQIVQAIRNAVARSDEKAKAMEEAGAKALKAVEEAAIANPE